MGAAEPVITRDSGYRIRVWLGVALIFAGLMGHVLAAQAIGGTHVAFRDHLVGFVGSTLIFGLIIAAIGWRFWKGRHDITILATGVVTAALGLYVYIERFSIHG